MATSSGFRGHSANFSRDDSFYDQQTSGDSSSECDPKLREQLAEWSFKTPRNRSSPSESLSPRSRPATPSGSHPDRRDCRPKSCSSTSSSESDLENSNSSRPHHKSKLHGDGIAQMTREDPLKMVSSVQGPGINNFNEWRRRKSGK
ncbi:hypothetical protein T439DRAFT_177849 [Meredithblackwellia eburnea MCA 4105]